MQRLPVQRYMTFNPDYSILGVDARTDEQKIDALTRNMNMVLGAVQLICDPRGSQQCRTPRDAVQRLNELRLLRAQEFHQLRMGRYTEAQIESKAEILADQHTEIYRLRMEDLEATRAEAGRNLHFAQSRLIESEAEAVRLRTDLDRLRTHPFRNLWAWWKRTFEQFHAGESA